MNIRMMLILGGLVLGTTMDSLAITLLGGALLALAAVLLWLDRGDDLEG